MRRCLAGVIAVAAGAGLAVLPPAPAAAQGSAEEAVSGFESAGALLRRCRENSSFAKNYCFAYLAAVADAARAYRVWTGGGDPCLPAGLTMGRLADIFTAYLVANPSQTESQAASVIVASLQESFPCAAAAPAPVQALAPPSPGPSGDSAPGEVDPAPQQHRQP